MLNKIYLIALAIFFLVMCILTYLAYDWLGSLTAPNDVVKNFQSWFSTGRIFLLISSLVLIILSNIILWKTRQTFAFWATLGYFVIFILVQTFWLDRAFEQYQIDKKLIEDEISFAPVIGVFMIIAAAFLIFFNQFLALRMHDKMFAKDAPIKELPDDETVAEDKETAS